MTDAPWLDYAKLVSKMECKNILLLLVIALLLTGNAQGESLPYTTRTKPYAGAGTGVKGDIRTIGMAGATVGLGDTFIASQDNPAGLAMTLGGGDDHYAYNRARDSDVQSYDSPLDTTSFGLALSSYPWGYSVGYVSPYREGQFYDYAQAPGDPGLTQVVVREFRFGVGRVLARNKLAIGMNFNILRAENEIEFEGHPQYADIRRSYRLGASLGVMYQLPRRVILGLSYTPGTSYNVEAGDRAATPVLPGFFQPVLVPWKLGLGVGWIPNRALRADATLFAIGSTPGAALLRDERIAVGEGTTLQPRLGVAYVFADFKDFQGTAFGGAYFEKSRIAGAVDRTHFTGGIELKPWILNVGWAVDSSAHYLNYLVGIGFNLFKILEKTELIPAPPRPPASGWLPRMGYESDEGLPRPLVANWKPSGKEIDPIKVGLALPKKIVKQAQKAGQSIVDTLEDVVQPADDEAELKKQQLKASKKGTINKAKTKKKPKSETATQ